MTAADTFLQQIKVKKIDFYDHGTAIVYYSAKAYFFTAFFP